MLHASYKRRFRSLLILCLAGAITSLSAFCTYAADTKATNSVVISRFLANPKGSDKDGEWIELMNQSPASIHLKGWKLKKEVGTVKTYKLPAITLNPQQIHRFSSTDSKIQLRNKNGDALTLFDDHGLVADHLEWRMASPEDFVASREMLLRDADRKSEMVQVVRVIDGDTLEVEFADKNRDTVRLIGVDTPETVDPDQSVQQFGPEASAYTKSQLQNKTVRLEYAELIKKGHARMFEKSGKQAQADTRQDDLVELVAKVQAKTASAKTTVSNEAPEPWWLLALLMNGLGLSYWIFKKLLAP